MEHDLLDVAAGYAGQVDLEQVNASEDPDRARALRTIATPTLIGFSEGAEVFRSTGRASASELEAMFASLVSGETTPPPVPRSQTALAGASGVALIGAGLATGPSMPLMIIGAGALTMAAVPYARRWRANRS